MCLIETSERILYHLEAIDIENNEYLFWDSAGAGVRISMARGEVKQIERCDQTMSLREAFDKYAESNGLRVIPGESQTEIWRGFESQIPPRRTLWGRLFRKSNRYSQVLAATIPVKRTGA